jgi:hypothetical protein
MQAGTDRLIVRNIGAAHVSRHAELRIHAGEAIIDARRVAIMLDAETECESQVGTNLPFVLHISAQRADSNVGGKNIREALREGVTQAGGIDLAGGEVGQVGEAVTSFSRAAGDAGVGDLIEAVIDAAFKGVLSVNVSEIVD